jgi:hypothetical protein
MFKSFLIIVSFVMFSFAGMAQTSGDNDKSKSSSNVDLALEGMAGVSFGRNFYAFNVGGPSLRLRITEDLRIGVGALPSFYIKKGKTGGKLGVAPRVDFKDWVFFAPFFHFDDPDQWVFSVGFGYKFGGGH